MSRRVRSWIASLLMICLCAGLLTGCGGPSVLESTAGLENKTEPDAENLGESTAAAPEETEAETEAEPYTGPIYDVNWLDVDLMVESITEVSAGGDVLYLRGATEKDKDGKEKHVIISCDLDGTGQQMVFEIEEPEKSPELSEGETHICSSYRRMNADSDGNLIMMFMEYRYAYGQKMKEIYRLLKLDREGNELWSTDLPERVNPIEMICAGDHTVVTLESISENNGVLGPTEVLVYDKDGALKARHNTEIRSILGLCSHGDRAYLYDGPDPYYGDAKLREIDLETGEFGDEFGGGLEWYGDWVGAGCGYDLLTEDGGAIWGFNFDENYSVKVLDYGLSGIYPQYNNVMLPVGESDFLLITGVRSYNNTQPQIALLTRATREAVESKQEITVAIIGGTSGPLTVEFNAENEQYRVDTVGYVEIPEYGEEYLDREEYRKAVERLKEDIEAGKAPDVVILGEYEVGLLYEELCEGVFEDLYPWLDSDEEFSREKLFANALKAGELDGKLYSLIPSFDLRTMIGKTSIFGPSDGCTATEMLEISRLYPHSEICPDIRGVYAISDLVENSGNLLIDEKAGEVRFTSDEFIAMLEIAKRMNELGDVLGTHGTWYKNNDILLQEIQITNYAGLKLYDESYGETVSCVGYPGMEKNGSVLHADTCVLMLSQSDCKEGAWAFIRSYLQESYECDQTYVNFPILLNAQEALAESQTAWYEEKDIYGNITMKQIASEADVARISEIIRDADSALYQNSVLRTELVEVVKEKAALYFSGEKTAQTVAEEIQQWVEVRLSKPAD